MAGDRRATAGNLISTRSVEKVVQADDLSGVAIAGTAGPAMEMIKLFQLQLEYYEKVEGQTLSLEGKANQLSMMVRSNLPAAMQGFLVVPLFAGYDPLAGRGRLWDFDATGGRYEERDFVAVGSGSTLASTVLRVGWKKNLSRESAIDLAARALWEASDADTATGGPDVLRGIYPIVASIDASGWNRVSDEALASTYDAIMTEVRAR
jgi:proteasome beta subunit